MVDQPVDDRIGDDGIAEDLSPLRQRLIGSDDDGPLLVSCRDELEEKTGDVPVDREIPYLVDEIDRCLPDKQLKILERLHHLFDVKNCAVIVTMNQRSVAETVKTIYGVDGYLYLRKFFDFTFRLSMSANDYLNNWLNDFIKIFVKMGVPEDHAEIPAKLAYQSLLYGNEKVLSKSDNREMTRYYEGVINVCNDFGWEKIRNSYYVFFVLVALYIRRMIDPSFLDPKSYIALSFLWKSKAYPIVIGRKIAYLFPAQGTKKNANQ